MKEIKLWEIGQKDGDKSVVLPLKNVDQTKTENQLEEILVKYPDLLGDGLKLVGRQTNTAGGPLDLLGVDDDGRLVVFELKRGTLTRNAVSQIIDYSSYLDDLDPKVLASHIAERSGTLGVEKIDDFGAWYQEQYQKSIFDIQKPKLVLVGLGADECTRRMVSFLADSDIDISLITFYGFEKDGKTFLAKQVEVAAKSPVNGSSLTKEERLKLLREKVKRVGVDGVYEKIADFFRIQLSAYPWPNQSGYSFYLTDVKEDGSPTNLVYISLYVNENQPNRLEIRIQERAIEVAPGQFEKFSGKMTGKLKKRPAGGASVWVSSLKDWGEIEEDFKTLCKAVHSGWQKKRESAINNDL